MTPEENNCIKIFQLFPQNKNSLRICPNKERRRKKPQIAVTFAIRKDIIRIPSTQ